jgi:pimeloyl-ACP methyl ester carboxylesterase
VGDREYLVRQVGAGDGPDVVLVHGLGGASLAEWFKIGPSLAERYRLTIVDNRSHGLSPKTTDRFEIEDVADDIAGVISRLGIVEADFVGYSMGGTITQALAHRHPHLVRRLVLIATFARHPRPWRLSRVVGSVVIRAWERVTGIGSAEVRAGYLLAAGAVEQRHGRWLWEETHRRDPEAGAAASLALLRFDSTPWIGTVRQPALVVIPLSDQLVPNRWQYELASMLPNSSILELVRARHEAPFTHAEQIAESIIEFFEKDAPPGPAPTGR